MEVKGEYALSPEEAALVHLEDVKETNILIIMASHCMGGCNWLSNRILRRIFPFRIRLICERIRS